MTEPEEGLLWTVIIPGGGIKKVRLPPLPVLRVVSSSPNESTRDNSREILHHSHREQA